MLLVDGAFASKLMLPCKPEKVPFTSKPKLAIVNPTDEPFAAGLYCAFAMAQLSAMTINNNIFFMIFLVIGIKKNGTATKQPRHLFITPINCNLFSFDQWYIGNSQGMIMLLVVHAG